MQVTYASAATPGGVNEDHVVAGDGWAAVLDGATARPGVVTGCAHDPAWLVRRLGGALAVRLGDGAGDLRDVLAEAIDEVRTRHDGCDLGNPDSPSTTVSIVRWHGRRLDWLVLADSPVLVDDGAVRVVRDDRVDRLPSYTAEAVRAARNSAGGFWVASTRPEAAYEAVVGTAPDVRRAAVLSDGASRLVELFGALTWPGLLDALDAEGPAAVIARTRAAEAAHTAPIVRGKPHDDATAVVLRAIAQS
ncbi:protein phosphatase 2C domain-containing protein [Actinomadura flavalba]|uniref:protein phosphatase 2C domain-containing protein n=1 Tax=Actinomadura flavalba TaxID=1120938 RepID=UPI00035E3203|nr:protein phosphatase 2C domain-containing protein [Actinomadura flavalba]